MEVIYEDNHLIIINKSPGEIVQGDKTGDEPLVETLKHWLKEKYGKPGNVFCGVVHRLDRPVGGLVVFAKTSKALTRLNDMFRNGEVEKTYWALSRNKPEPAEGRLVHFITTTERNNKSYASLTERSGSKRAVLTYRLLGCSDRYNLIEVKLETGRKHQIRVQLSSIGCPIKGDLKYGDKRSNPDGSISLMARRIRFTHPVSGKEIDVTAPLPSDPLWQAFDKIEFEDEK
ncbi:RluA family pseudouridine synthase [uncultured Duncaniella sp.]|jgi:23S rRNA pseudouridine1911/1915/1917 synthase|uniref:RluA family pseudouridine synthase n=2 Tax=uncultured Duncaniella sp. TaxID=2768039 RepID=UPI000F494C8E|nr:RluA family pseudouridine synthase [uncultured Duncaniella sp.]ROS87874.1 RluA family pseudouridine synthase [Muribaculaceae bacterium Isolate-080 (Janvier)]